MNVNTLRPRRLRRSAPMRAMIRENHLSLNDLIYPIFVVPGTKVKEEIPSMPDCYHLSVDNAVALAEEIRELGIKADDQLLRLAALRVLRITGIVGGVVLAAAGGKGQYHHGGKRHC